MTGQEQLQIRPRVISTWTYRKSKSTLHTLLLSSFESCCSSLQWRTKSPKLGDFISFLFFFNLSVALKKCLQDKILLYFPESLKHKLKDVCRTRWVERMEGMNILEKLCFQCIIIVKIIVLSIAIIKLQLKQSHCSNLLMILNSFSPRL